MTRAEAMRLASVGTFDDYFEIKAELAELKAKLTQVVTHIGR